MLLEKSRKPLTLEEIIDFTKQCPVRRKLKYVNWKPTVSEIWITDKSIHSSCTTEIFLAHTLNIIFSGTLFCKFIEHNVRPAGSNESAFNQKQNQFMIPAHHITYCPEYLNFSLELFRCKVSNEKHL